MHYTFAGRLPQHYDVKDTSSSITQNHLRSLRITDEAEAMSES